MSKPSHDDTEQEAYEQGRRAHRESRGPYAACTDTDVPACYPAHLCEAWQEGWLDAEEDAKRAEHCPNPGLYR